MEIRTCEEYVIAELFDAKNEIDRLQQVAAERESALNDVTKSFQDLKDLICKYAQISRFGADNDEYISFSNIWKLYEEDDFNLLKSLIPELHTEKS